MKVVIGVILLIIVAENLNASKTTFSREVIPVFEQRTNGTASLLKAESIFIVANLKFNNDTIHHFTYDAPKGKFVDYIELLGSQDPDYAGTKLSYASIEIIHPLTHLPITLRNGKPKGIDVRVLIYGKDIERALEARPWS